MQSLVIDNFLPYPNVVREWALTKEFYTSTQFSQRIGKSTTWPGQRSDHVMDLDLAYANDILNNVGSIARKIFADQSLSIRSYFQLCAHADGDSWIHQDNDVDVAAILYLSPDAPVSSGTTLYRCLDQNAWNQLSFSEMTKINRIEREDLYKKLFEPVDVIGNVYNRLVMYRGDIFHKSNDYFGSTKYDSRLTQVFFLKFER
jgi:hypothetical protein